MPPALAPAVLLAPAVPSRRGGRVPAVLPSPTPAETGIPFLADSPGTELRPDVGTCNIGGAAAKGHAGLPSRILYMQLRCPWGPGVNITE